MSSVTSSSDALRRFVARHPRLLVLTGAGCSTESGIPDYRDAAGDWKRPQPVRFQDFVQDPVTRQRYWARSLIGWPAVQRAAPNAAHRALAYLEHQQRIEHIITQNVDGLHQRAGSRAVIDLHGRLDRVRCLECGARQARQCLQHELLCANPQWEGRTGQAAPDGDADLSGPAFDCLRIPACAGCGGVLKPDVVFFGESVPRDRVDKAMHHLQRADALLIVGSSLMVYSGYRFARCAAEHGKPIGAINLGRTRADALLTVKVEQACGSTLAALLDLPPLNAPAEWAGPSAGIPA